MKSAAQRVAAYQAPLLAILLAVSFVTRGPLIALPFVGVTLLWGVRWAGYGRPWIATPFNGPLAVLLGFSTLALLPSVDPLLSLTRLGNLLLGVALVQAILAGGPAASWRNLYAALLAVNWLLLPLVVAGTDWADKASLLGAAGYAQLPRWLPNIFTNSYGQTQAGVQPNQLAAILAILLPLAIMLLRRPPPTEALAAPPATAGAGRLGARLISGLLGRRALITLAGLTVAAIALTQSRGALIGVVLSQALLWGLPYRRRLLPLVGLGGVGAGLGVALIPAWRTAATALFLPAGPQHYLSNTLAIRVELWQRAVRMISDYPFTGIGLNTFPKIQPALYPVFSFARNAYDLPTAHNFYLQAPLDYGLPGALALAVFLSVLGHSLVRAYRVAPAWRGPALALAAAGVAWLGYGLLDVLDLGAKGAYILWVVIAMIAKLAAETGGDRAIPVPARRRVGRSHLALVGAATLGLLVLWGPQLLAAAYVNAASIVIGKAAAAGRPAEEAAATPALQSAVRYRPADSGALYQQGRVALAAGDWATAQQRLTVALAHSPHDGLLHYLLGEAYQGGGQAAAAAREWHQANAWFLVFPQRVGAGQAALEAGQVDAAAGAFAQAAVLAPDLDADHHAWLADLYWGQAAVQQQRNEPAAAEASYALALAADPHNVQALVESGEFYVDTGRVAAGVARVEQAVRENPQNRWATLKLADLDQAIQRPDAAVAALRQALLVQPADGELYFALGNAQQAAGDVPGSCASWRKATELAPAGAPFAAALQRQVQSCGAGSRLP